MSKNKHDILTEEDVAFMVNTFYEKVNKDDLLSYVFNDYAQVDWEAHLPKMYSFWNTLIFGARTYKGKPFDTHIGIPIDKAHFDRWVQVFKENIDEHFHGNIAESTKTRAQSIAYVFQTKLEAMSH